MIHKFSRSLAPTALLFVGLLASQSAAADVGIGARVGFLSGIGVDLNIGLSERLTARVAYNYFSYDYEVEDTDVTYDGTFKISSVSGFLDWHPFAGSFRLSLGAVSSGPKIEIDGTPSAGTTVEIGDTTYTAAQIGSLKGEIEFGNSVSPYIGIGWGNVVDKNHRVVFLADFGVVYAGTPDVSLTATCGAALTTTQCNTLQSQLRTDVEKEKRELEADGNDFQWYPIINIGIGVRF